MLILERFCCVVQTHHVADKRIDFESHLVAPLSLTHHRNDTLAKVYQETFAPQPFSVNDHLLAGRRGDASAGIPDLLLKISRVGQRQPVHPDLVRLPRVADPGPPHDVPLASNATHSVLTSPLEEATSFKSLDILDPLSLSKGLPRHGPLPPFVDVRTPLYAESSARAVLDVAHGIWKHSTLSHERFFTPSPKKDPRTMQPDFEIVSCDPERRSDGVVLLTIGNSTRAVRKSSPYEAIVAIDRQGRIVWRREFEFCLMDVRRSRQETLLVMGTGGIACEIDLSGRLLHKWYARGLHGRAPDGVLVETLKFHHSIFETKGGRLLSLSLEHRQLETPTEDADFLMLDTVLLWNRDGSVERELSLAEVCDIERYSHDFAPIYYENQGWPRTRDWSHGNCVIEDPDDLGYLMSFRHQDSVVKIDRDGSLKWIFGVDAGFRPQFRDKLLKPRWDRPFWHQHDLSFTSEGDLMLFDNGTAGAFPPEPKKPLNKMETFAVSFAIDEAAMTATETWRYGGHGRLPFSLYVGGVCEMPNRNKFIACTGLSHQPDGALAPLPTLGIGSIDLTEVTPEGEAVFQARLSAPGAVVDRGWNGFRPEYLKPDLANRLSNTD